MNILHASPSLQINKHTAILLTACITLAGLISINAILSKPASAIGCVRAPHTVTVTNGSQSATPGSTLYYHLEITNNDSADCGSSTFVFNTSQTTSGWTVAPNNGDEPVDYSEITGYTVWYTSPVGAYNGDYDQVIAVSRTQEPTVVSVPVRYTVVGGQDVPAPDTSAPTVTISSPAANTILKKNTNVTIQASATDNTGVTRIEYYINNTLFCSGTATSCVWRVPNTKANYQLTVKAFDAAGNVGVKNITVSAK